MMFPEEPVQLQFPTYDNIFTSNEVEHLFSLFESGFPADSNSGSEPSRAVYSVEERQRRRMISNRESARRSRWRKKRHLENLTNQVNQLKAENRDLKNRLSLVFHQCYAAETETDRLLTESLQLQQRLSGLCQILVNTQFQ